MIASRKPVAAVSPLHTRSLNCFVLALACVAPCVTLGQFASPQPAFAQTEPPVSITILIYDYADVLPRILAGAERQADKLLHEAGVEAIWINCADKHLAAEQRAVCKGGWGYRNVGLRLISRQVSDKFEDVTFGFAVLPGLASVYYSDAEHLARRLENEFELPTLLGSFMAHEVGHLLLNSRDHSETGIMQARWGVKQIRESSTGRLTFTAEQSNLIHQAVKARMNLPLDNPPSEIASR